MKVHYVETFYPGPVCSDTGCEKVGEKEKFKPPKQAYGWRRMWREEKEENGEMLLGGWHHAEMHFCGGRILTLKQMIAEKGAENNAVYNMQSNGWDRVVDTGRGTFPLDPGDVVEGGAS